MGLRDSITSHRTGPSADADHPAPTGAAKPSPRRMKILFLVEWPSGKVHIAPYRPDPVAPTALCGMRPRDEWTRCWESEIMVPVSLIGVCPACATAVRERA
jgi:hypothetical protein